MTYTFVQKDGDKYYLIEATSHWDPVKKRSVQKRKHLGVCDAEGNLLKPKKSNDIECSPSFGSCYLMVKMAEKDPMTKSLYEIYGEEKGKRLMTLAILSVIEPCSVNMMACAVEDTYLRQLLGVDWSMEQSEVCRFLQTIGRDAGRRERLFAANSPKSGCVIFDIVCLGTDSEELEFAERGRKFRYTGSKQINLGMVHSMKAGLPFCYRTYPGSVADVSTIKGLISDLRSMGCRSVESVMDRGFYSLDNIKFMLTESSGFTIPMPTKVDAEKKLISESVGKIDSPLNTDVINGSTVRGYETAVRIEGNDMVCCGEDRRDGDIRAVVLQDNAQRSKELDRLYSNLSKLEKRLAGMEFKDGAFVHSLNIREKNTLKLLEYSEGGDGKIVTARKRNAISARENSCGSFVLLTTSDLPWKSLMENYRSRNDIEYDFSILQSDLFEGTKGKSDQNSAEGGLLVCFLAIRLRLILLHAMQEAKLTDTLWTPELLKELGKLKASRVGGKWRLNVVTKRMRTIYEELGVKVPTDWDLAISEQRRNPSYRFKSISEVECDGSGPDVP